MSRPTPIDYVLGELPPDERAEAERLLRSDPDFRAEVERLLPIAASLGELPAEGWSDLEPPPLPPLSDEPRAVAEPAANSGTRASARRWLPAWPRGAAIALAAGCAALLAGIVIGFALDGGGDPDAPGGEAVSLRAVDGSGTGGGEVVRTGREQIRLSVNDLPANRPGEFYEAWLLDRDERAVSLGGFRVGESGSTAVTLPLPEDPAAFRYFDVSVEPADRDPAHSGDSVLRAPT